MDERRDDPTVRLTPVQKIGLSTENEMPIVVREAARDPVSVVGRYVRVRLLGQGGMGVVWLAWDVQLRRYVALKLLSGPGGSPVDGTDTAGDEIRRFYREARTAANLRHPNIVATHDVGEEKDAAGRTLYYISMEYVDGQTLDKAGLSQRRALEVVRDAARGVDHAHVAGVIHRDLKPQNIMIDKAGHAFVMDFGLAKRANIASSLSATGDIVGTPAYMPPEQAGGHTEAVGVRSDVYALGATLYAAVCGGAPYRGATAFEILHAVQSGEPPRPRTVNPKLHADIETIILRAMERDPARRYATAAEFAADLERFLEGEPILARPTSRVMLAFRKVRRSRVFAAWAVSALLAAVAIVALVFAFRTSAAEPEPWVTVFSDDFDRATLGPRWDVPVPARSNASVHDGEYCSRAAILVFTAEVPGDVEFEFEGRVMPDSLDCREISCFVHGGRQKALEHGYAFEFGITGNTVNCIQRARGATADARGKTIEQGRRYHMRASRVGDVVSYHADGELLATYRDPRPLPSTGYLGFASQCAHVHFDRVRVRQPLAAAQRFADRAFEAGDYALAEPVYRACEAHPQPPELTARRAICLQQVGKGEEAERIGRQLAASKDPDAAAVGVVSLGEIYLLQFRFADADEVLGAALVAGPPAGRSDQIDKLRLRALTVANMHIVGDEWVRFCAARGERWRATPSLASLHLRAVGSMAAQAGDQASFDDAVRQLEALKTESKPLDVARASLEWQRGEIDAARKGLREAWQRFPPDVLTEALLLLAWLEAAEDGAAGRPLQAIEEIAGSSPVLEYCVAGREAVLVADLLMRNTESARRRVAELREMCRRGVDLTSEPGRTAEYYAGRVPADTYVTEPTANVFRPERLLRMGWIAMAEGDTASARPWLEKCASAKYAGSLRVIARKLLERLK